MSETPGVNDRWDSGKKIAHYVGRNVRTVIRWEQVGGFPVHRIPVGQRQAVFAYRHEIDSWLAGSNLASDESYSDVRAANGNADSLPENEADLDYLPPDSGYAEATSRMAGSRTWPRWKAALYAASGFVAAILLAGLIWRFGGAKLPSRSPQLTDPQQLTFNGMEKDGLQTDGRQLYFGQNRNGWLALTAMAADGGAIRVLWNPPMSVLPVDVSRNGKLLLALTYLDVEKERQIWVVPLDGGKPYRPGNLTAHSAVWSLDGRTIAFANGQKIYLVAGDGTEVREVGSFSQVPESLHWSDDGTRLRFELSDPSLHKLSIWELEFPGGRVSALLRVLSTGVGLDAGNLWSRGSRANEYIFSGGNNGDRSQLRMVEYGRRWWQPAFEMRTLDTGLEGLEAITFMPASNRLFAINSLASHGGIEEFDPGTKQFRHILSGVSAGYMDYSHDGKWVAWVDPEDRNLWVSRSDGAMPKKLVSLQNIELPRWSPDGRQIAFMGRESQHPMRIYIVWPESGTISEASEGDDNQGAPTWSPDGKFLVYGNVFCQASHSCAIHRIDLSTGKVNTLPGSEGLMTARWSPDGRYVSAMQPERHELLLFDVRSAKWRKLANSMTGADLSWSPDSRFLYSDIPGANARIVRVSAATRAMETVLDLRLMDRFILGTAHDAVFCLAPNGNLLFPWPSAITEIYSFRLQN